MSLDFWILQCGGHWEFGMLKILRRARIWPRTIDYLELNPIPDGVSWCVVVCRGVLWCFMVFHGVLVVCCRKSVVEKRCGVNFL